MPMPGPASSPTLAVQLDMADAGRVYRHFASVVGEEVWMEHIRKVDAAIKGCPTLAEFLVSENEISYALDFVGAALRQHGTFAMPVAEARKLFPAFSFAAQVLSMIELYGPDEGERFRRRAADALTNPDAMRGLRLEMMAATHFQRRGHKPEWPEQSGAGTFDLLIPSLGPLGLEVECKAISDDKGRAVHVEEALRFIDLLLKRDVHAGVVSLVGVSITLPNRMPKSPTDRHALADAVHRCVVARSGAELPDGTQIRVVDHDRGLLAGLDVTKRTAVRDLVQHVTGTDNRHGVLVGAQDGGAVAIALQSRKDDAVLKTIFDTLKEAAKWQLTKSRPGLLVAGLYGLSESELRSVADQDHDLSQVPTGLAVHVHQVLSAPHREHVVGAAFMSRSALMPRQDGTVDSGGTVYKFTNDRGPLWSEAFRNLFGQDA